MRPLMNIMAIGVNHRTAPVEVRERFAISEADIAPCLHSLVGDGTIRELAILSTCNRVEVYAVSGDVKAATRMIFDALKNRSGLDPEARNDFYIHEQPSSVQHLYEVCAGLDSMVVGETEILGQVKEAYRIAHEAHRTGLALNKLFQSAFAVAKEIRSRTRIGMGSVSVGSVAVDLAGQIFGDLDKRTVLLIGAGETSETTARSLQSRGAKSLVIANRSLERARALADSLHGRAVELDSWTAECERADIVISSTAAPHPVITREKLEGVMQRRNGSPLFLIDIAVPCDIEREVSQLAGIYLYDIDDLQVIADQNLAMRQKEIAVCKQIIREHVDRFSAWFSEQGVQIAKCPTARKMAAWRKSTVTA